MSSPSSTTDDSSDSRLQNATSSLNSSSQSCVLNTPPFEGIIMPPESSDSNSPAITPTQVCVPSDDSVPIDAKMYMYLVQGNISDIRKTGLNLSKLKGKEDENTVLHVAACAGQAQLISDIIPQCKDIFKSKNSKKETAFHCAAKSAHLDTLKALSDWSKYDVDAESSKSVLAEQDDKGDTALHIALKNNQEDMADYLVKEYPKASCVMNEKDISPLYMAVNLKNLKLVKQMMIYIKQFEHEFVDELLSGRSVVHAAIEIDSIDILKEILDFSGELLNSFEDGHTPLSYAAYKGRLDTLRYLLEKFPHLAYACNYDGSFPIHSACSGGHVEAVQALHRTKHLLNIQGQSILHVAAAHGKADIVSHLLTIVDLERLINLKDDDGNTPLHLAAGGFHPRVVYILTREPRVRDELRNNDGLTALDVVEIHADSPISFEARLTWMALRYINSPRSSQSTREKYSAQQLLKPRHTNSPHNSQPTQQNYSTQQIEIPGYMNSPRSWQSPRQNHSTQQTKKLDNPKADLEPYKNRSDTLLLVATLVATVAFAAGFTVPGSYNQDGPNIGMAVLVEKWAFQAFVICNTAALFTSILCVVSLIWSQMEDLKLILLSYKFAIPLLGFALTMMSLAFTMGLFLVLRNLPWLSYAVLVMGFVFMVVVFLVFIPLVNPSYISNSVVRFLFTGPFLLLLLACEKRTFKYH